MKTTLSRFFGPIITKFAFIMGAIAAMTAAAIAISYSVFVNFGDALGDLTDRHVPNLRTNTLIIADAGDVEDGLTEALLAHNQAELGPAITHIDEAIEKLAAKLKGLPAKDRAKLGSLLDEAREQTRLFREARLAEFRADDELAAMIVQMATLSDQVEGTINAIKKKLSEQASESAKSTIESVDETLTKLVDVDFASLQLVLQIRADNNLLSGVIITLSQNPDPALRSILLDLGEGSRARLETNVPMLKQQDVTAAYHDKIEPVFKTLSDLLADTTTTKAEAALSARQAGDAALSSAVDDISFELAIQSGDAIDGTKSAISDLVDGQIASLRRLLEVNAAMGAFLIEALKAASLRDKEAFDQAQQQLSANGEKLAAMAGEMPELQDIAAPISSIADPDTGIVTIRQSSLAARSRAEDISRKTAESIATLARDAMDLAGKTLNEVTTSSGDLRASVGSAQTWMQIIAVTSVLILIAMSWITYVTIARPVRQLTDQTEKLSQGSLDEIAIRADRWGEVGDMARALHVFRDGLLEKIRLEEADKIAAEERAAARAQQDREERERARAESDRLEAEARREREEDIRKQREKEAREAEEHQLAEERRLQKEREEAERAEMRRVAEEQRAAQAAEQEAVVNALAEGLRQLSQGRLDAHIDKVFAEGYERLRLDFNATVDSLSDAVRTIVDSSNRIGENVNEIDQAASNLSTSTESTAATLKQSSAALRTLTKSVEGTAEGASEVERSATHAKKEAETGTGIVAEATAAMEAIKKSSEKINNITGLIEEISFQTNLLALNAGVEAARAGEAGRGFSVVASEVRALAQKSSEAASEINKLIAESGREVENGAASVDRTGAALSTISQSIFDVSEHIVRIAESAQRQASEISEINGAVEELETSTQHNAAMAEEMSTASNKLRSETGGLTGAVSRFSTGVLDNNSEQVSTGRTGKAA